MTKKQQKWITLLVTLTFMWLLQVSAMPLPAVAPAVSSNAGQGTDHYEAIGQKTAPAKKGSILPWILVGVGVVAVTAVVLFLFVLNKYDITGSWNFVFTSGSYTESYVLTFSGDRKSGTFLFTIFPAYAGPYAVDGKKVTMTLSAFPQIQFSGEFTGKDEMKGTWITTSSGNFDWTAKRGDGTSRSNPLPASASRLLSR